MLRREKVTLRAARRRPRGPAAATRLPERRWVELAGGGDPPRPAAPERLQKTFGQEATKPPGRDKTEFAVEADGHLIGHLIGHRGPFDTDEAARHCEP
jgi:hypothetical protein